MTRKNEQKLQRRVREIGIVRQRSWEMNNWSGCVHLRYLHRPKGPLHCPSFYEWQKRGTRMVSWEAAGSEANAVEEDD